MVAGLVDGHPVGRVVDDQPLNKVYACRRGKSLEWPQTETRALTHLRAPSFSEQLPIDNAGSHAIDQRHSLVFNEGLGIGQPATERYDLEGVKLAGGLTLRT